MRKTAALASLTLFVIAGSVVAAATVWAGRTDEVRDVGASSRVEPELSASQVMDLFLEQVAVERAVVQHRTDDGKQHRSVIQSLTDSDILNALNSTPISTLPDDILDVHNSMRLAGVDRKVWIETLAQAVISLSQEVPSPERDRVLGPAANFIAAQYIGLAADNQDNSFATQAVDLLLFAIREFQYHPARVESGRLLGTLAAALDGAGSEARLEGLSASVESFEAMPDGAEKELVRHLYVNAASHLGFALRANGDYAAAAEVHGQLVMDVANHRHFSSADTLASIYMSAARSALRTPNIEAAKVAMDQAVAHVTAHHMESSAFEPLAVRYELACRLDDAFPSNGLVNLQDVTDDLFEQGRLVDASVATLELVMRLHTHGNDDEAFTRFSRSLEELIAECSGAVTVRADAEHLRQFVSEFPKLSRNFQSLIEILDQNGDVEDIDSSLQELRLLVSKLN